MKNPGRDKSRATAERFEEHVKDLIDKLAKELGPVGEELRKALEKSVDEIHETLKKEGVTPDDLRRRWRSRTSEMRKALEKGGAVNKELRGAVEKSRQDVQEEWERSSKRAALCDARASPGPTSGGTQRQRAREMMPINPAKPLRKRVPRSNESVRKSRRHAARFVRSSSSCVRQTAGSSSCNGDRCNEAAPLGRPGRPFSHESLLAEAPMIRLIRRGA